MTEYGNEAPTLLGRLGNVLYWLGTSVAILLGGISVIVLVFGDKPERWLPCIFIAVVAAVFWGIGRTLRYFLAGS